MEHGIDLKKCLDIALATALEAGKIIGSAIKEAKEVTNKTARDFVTDTDEKCEKLILHVLRSEFPEHKFIGEEETANAGQMPELTDDPTWFCDPLDGTTNFVQGFPFVCVSIALAVEKKPVVAVVYAPILDMTYTATKGSGTYLNGSLVSTSNQQDFSKSLVITELGPDRSESTLDTWMGRYRAAASECRSIRSVGSCAIGMSFVASGRADIMYEIGFGGPWDCAAGALLVTEAGGCVFDPSGQPFNIMSRRVACAASAAIGDRLSLLIAPFSANPNEPRYYPT